MAPSNSKGRRRNLIRKRSRSVSAPGVVVAAAERAEDSSAGMDKAYRNVSVGPPRSAAAPADGAYKPRILRGISSRSRTVATRLMTIDATTAAPMAS